MIYYTSTKFHPPTFLHLGDTNGGRRGGGGEGGGRSFDSTASDVTKNTLVI